MHSTENEKIGDKRDALRRNDLLPSLQIVKMRIEELLSAARRLRKVNPDPIDLLVSSIADLGFTQPILARGGVIIDGLVPFAGANSQAWNKPKWQASLDRELRNKPATDRAPTTQTCVGLFRVGYRRRPIIN